MIHRIVIRSAIQNKENNYMKNKGFLKSLCSTNTSTPDSTGGDGAPPKSSNFAGDPGDGEDFVLTHR